MGTTESNVDHAASGQTVAGDSGELTFTYAQGRFASEGKDWESPVVTNMAASVSADAGNVPAGSITNTGTNNTFTSTTESSLATLLSNQCPFVIKATIFEGNGKNAIRERHTFTGSVLRQLDQASALLNGINESGQYPAIALREALVNALEHRDYTYSGPTLINIFDSRLEIVSLGGLTDGLKSTIYSTAYASHAPRVWLNCSPIWASARTAVPAFNALWTPTRRARSVRNCAWAPLRWQWYCLSLYRPRPRPRIGPMPMLPPRPAPLTKHSMPKCTHSPRFSA